MMKVGDLVIVLEEYCLQRDYLCVVTEEGHRNSFGETTYRVIPVNKENEIPFLWVNDQHVSILSRE